MSSIYYLIFVNSFKSAVIMSMFSENAWFAALNFGGHNMLLATISATIGASLGTLLNFAIGYYVSYKRTEWFNFSEELYQKIHKYSKYSLVILLLPFPNLFIIGQFYSLFVLMAGVLKHSPYIILPLIIAGRLIYYGFYLIF